MDVKTLKEVVAKGSFALLDNNKAGGAHTDYLFWGPIAFVRADKQEDVEERIFAIESYIRDGYHVAGYFSYELGYALQRRLKGRLPEKREVPLFNLGIFRHRSDVRDIDVEQALEEIRQNSDTLIKNCTLTMDRASYVESLKKVKQHIHDGDTYQVNFTLKYKFDYGGPPLALYAELRRRQRVEYGAYLDFPEVKVLSRSPELFINKRGESIHAKPMKGTTKRGDTPEQDRENFDFLTKDEKSRAENVMIVDLLRNDLSRISKPGSVRTSGLFEVQTFETLHQMISTVSGQVDVDLLLSKLLQQIFPCGSITGAPKVRTMEIINDLEVEPRGIYTGAIGYFGPDQSICLNVPIRTLVLWPDGAGEMGVGSGVVHDSDPEAEYEECRLKGQFFTQGFADFGLIESLRFDAGYPHLDKHLQRLRRSAAELGFALDAERLERDLLATGTTLSSPHKVRVALDRAGSHVIECHPIEPSDVDRRIAIAPDPVLSANWALRHKLTRRTHYQATYEDYKRLGFYDVVFVNERNELTEGSFNNLFIRKGDCWYTPPLECGLLPGIQRQNLLESPTIRAVEKRLYLDDLRGADEIFLTNAVRGVVKVELAASRIDEPCSA